MNAWTGFWGTTPLSADVSQVRSALHDIGVGRILLSVMHAVWCQNPHLCNDLIYKAAADHNDIDPVPVLDPTIASWRDELQRVMKAPRARWVKLVPAYSGYSMTQAGDLLEALARVGLGAIIQVRMEDPRRHHPLAQVPDTPVACIVEAAIRHPEVNFIVGGGSSAALLGAKSHLAARQNLFADTSQVDGIHGIKPLLEAGLTDKLFIGSHAPFFTPLAGIARVISDLDDDTTQAILSGNANKLLEHKIKS